MGEKAWQGFDLRAPGPARWKITFEDRILARRNGHETRFALPQSGFNLSASVIPAGGGSSSSGSFILNSTIGQPLAGTTQTGDQFSLTSGFGAVVQGATSTPTPTPTPSPTPSPTPTPSTIQFSSGSYTVNETGPRVDITLTRSGDTTSSASVNFATNDSAGLTNCNVFNNVASPRCDYENTIGTATCRPAMRRPSLSRSPS